MDAKELKKLRKIQNKALAHSRDVPGNRIRGAPARKFALFTAWFASKDANKTTPEQMCIDLHITPMTAQKWVRQIESGQTAIGGTEIQAYTLYLKDLVYSGRAVAADRELYAKIIGALDTKQKVEISGLLSHDIIAGIILKADRDSNNANRITQSFLSCLTHNQQKNCRVKEKTKELLKMWPEFKLNCLLFRPVL